MIRVLLADGYVLVRRGIRTILEASGQVQVVGEAGDGEEAVQLARVLRPDVALLEVKMEPVDGLEATVRLRREVPETRVIILTAVESQAAWQAWRCGAQGYILKTVTPEQLILMLQDACRGGVPISASVTTSLWRNCSRGRLGWEPFPEELTPREREVLGLVARGASNQEIAESLYLSINTVKNHLRNIMEKLHCKNRAQAVAYALERGIVSGGLLSSP